MKKKDLLDFLGNKFYCRVKPSKIEGVGVFAIKDIPERTNLFEAYSAPRNDTLHERWYAYPTKEIKRLDKEIRKLIHDFCGENNGKVAISSNMLKDIEGGCVYLLNHSEKPNIKCLYPEGTYVTLRKIEKGEELCFNYDKDFAKAKEQIDKWTE